MPRPGSVIPKAPLAKIMHIHSGKRVSEGAVDVLEEYLQKECLKICERAVRIAEHSKRKTIQGADLKIAIK